MYNSGFNQWFENLRIAWQNLPDALVFALLTVATWLFIISLFFAIVRIFTQSCKFSIAGRNDILQDKLHNPYSWYDGTYELPTENIKKAMIYANLSYRTFWNAVIMYRYRICGYPWNQIYFRVNRWSDRNWFPITTMVFQTTMICSLCFIWGYPIFLIISLIRMKLYARENPLY